MSLTIPSITVTVHGTAAGDITTIDVDGTPLVIAGDRSWSADVTVPGTGTRLVAITAIGPTRRETRMVEVGAGSPPSAPG